MAVIKLDNFFGIAPMVDAKRLPPGASQLAVNCIFEAGDVRPIRDDASVNSPFSSPPLWRGSGHGAYHWYEGQIYQFKSRADVVNSPVVEDTFGRIYWTDGPGEAAQVAERDAIKTSTRNERFYVGGSGRDLGVKRLTSKPEVVSEFGEAPEIIAATLSKTAPVRVATASDHPFEDGKRVIVTFERLTGANVEENPPQRRGMSEIAGKTFVTRLIRDEGTGLVNRRVFDLVGSDATGYSDYEPSLWLAKIKRVFSDDDYESRSYVATRVNKYGEESQPSPASDVYDVIKGGAVNVSVDVPYDIYSDGDRIRLYRSVTGSMNTSFFFIKEVPVHSTGSVVIEDDVSFERLGELLPSETWAPPVVGMSGLVAMPGGFLVAFKDNMLYFSEPYMPHAWPAAYTRTVQHKIVAIGVYGQTLVVATEGKPYLASGADPASISLQQLDTQAACIAKRTMTSTGDGVIYATLDGLVHVSTAGVRNMTDRYFTGDQWRGLLANNIDSCVATWHDGKYLLFVPGLDSSDNYIYVFSPSQGVLNISKWGEYGSGISGFCICEGVYSPLDGTSFPKNSLFFGQGRSRSVFILHGGATKKGMNVVGGVITLPKPVTLSCGQVLADSYPVTIKVCWASPKGVNNQPDSLDYSASPSPAEFYSVNVRGPEPFRLPGRSMSREWRIDISGSNNVQQVVLASSMDEIKQL